MEISTAESLKSRRKKSGKWLPPAPAQQHLRSTVIAIICELKIGQGVNKCPGVLKFDLGTEVRSEVSTTTL